MSASSAIRLFVISLLFLAQVGEVAHALFVSHGTCLEHGELIDEHAPSAESAPAESPTDVLENPATPAAPEAHAHCAHVVFARALAGSTPARLGTVEARAVAQHPHESLAIIERSVLSVAPKCSPPVA